MFIIITGLILIFVALAMAYPVWQSSAPPIPMGPEAARRQDRIDLEIEKQTLLASIAELDFDLSQGRLRPEDHQRLRNIDEHRLLAILDRLQTLPESRPSAETSGQASARPAVWEKFGAVVTMVVLVLVAGLLYRFIEGRVGLDSQKLASTRASQQQAAGMPNPVEMVARLEKRLAENPNDLEGQIMAGRSYMALNRIEDAARSWTKVLELDPGNHEGHFYLGLLILQTTNREDTASLELALKHLDTALVKVPREPGVLWFKGVALVHLKRLSEADQAWTTAYQNLTPGTEDAEMIKQALQRLRAGDPPLF